MRRRTFLLAAPAFAVASRAEASETDVMTIGASSAPLHLIEYASATCPHCAHFHETNWARLKADYIDEGRVRLSLHELLTPPPPVALAMFQLARCGGAGGEEYFRRLGILFQRQRQILETGTMGGVRDYLVALGAEWGLVESEVMTSLNDPAGVDRIRRMIADASQRGVTGTPAFFLNGAAITDQTFLTPEGMVDILNERLSR